MLGIYRITTDLKLSLAAIGYLFVGRNNAGHHEDPNYITIQIYQTRLGFFVA